MTLSEILSLDPRPKYVVKKGWSLCGTTNARIVTTYINLRLEHLTVSGAWVPAGHYLPTIRDMTDQDWQPWADPESSP